MPVAWTGKLSDNAVINIKQNLSFSNTVTIEGSANAGGLTGVMANEGAKANNGAKNHNICRCGS